MSKNTSEHLSKEPRRMFQAPATIGKIQTLSDGGSKIDIFVQELSPEDAAVLFSFRGKAGNIGFKEGDFSYSEIAEPDPVDGKESKTPAQRLRSVLYVFWEKNTSKKVPFDDFYRSYLEKIITSIKEKIS